MIRIIFILVILLFISIIPVETQSNENGNFMLKRFESTIPFDYLQEYSSVLARYVEKSNSRGRTRVAIRFCSTKPLKEAVTRGVIGLASLLGAFEDLGFRRTDVILLQSDDCVSDKPLIWPTELWVINAQDSLPTYKEKFYSNEIRSSIIGTPIQRFLGDRYYLKNARNLAMELIKDKAAFGVIYIPYRKTMLETAESFRRKILDELIKAGISTARYSIEMIRWNEKLSIEPIKVKTMFPVIHLVVIKPDQR